MVSDGSWQKALDANVGPSGFKVDTTTNPPKPEPAVAEPVSMSGCRRPTASSVLPSSGAVATVKEGCDGLRELLARVRRARRVLDDDQADVLSAIGALVIGTVVAVMRVSPDQGAAGVRAPPT